MTYARQLHGCLVHFPSRWNLTPSSSFYPSLSLTSEFCSFHHYSMPHPPRPLALFSLCPYRGNERAKRAVARKISITCQHYLIVYKLSTSVFTSAVNHLQPLQHYVEADIYVEGFSIAKIQCSFEIDLDAGVVMFFDRSHGCTTRVSGENATPFEHGRVQKVLVQKKINTIIRMGGERRDLV